MTTAEDYLKNEKWVKRISVLFSQFDSKKHGYLSREDYELFHQKMAKIVTDRPALIAKAQEVTFMFTDALGLTEGVRADKQKYLALVAELAVAERERMKRGEETLVAKMYDAFFDIADKNHDGYVTLEEYKIFNHAINYPPDTADATFSLLDKKKTGKIERKEFINAASKFWCILDDPDTKGLLGQSYE